ncbi:MAG TPA: hypothetical protein VN451_09525 [Chitinophagaceae bacterium]|nr:hypothetical protein [Chitinophagaceae bacterium]
MKLYIFLLLLSVSVAACTNYGKKVKKGNIEVYYKDGISKGEAEKTADILYNSVKGTAGAEGRKSMQLKKGNGDTILFRMVVDKEKLSLATDENFLAIAIVLSDSVFAGNPVNVDLTGNSFKTIRSIAFARNKMPDFGEKIISGNIEVYALEKIDPKTANDLASFLDDFIHPEFIISYQISKNESNEFVIKMASTEAKAVTVTNQMLSEISGKISTEVLNGSPLIFQMTDEKFNPMKTFSYPTDAGLSDSTFNNE